MAFGRAKSGSPSSSPKKQKSPQLSSANENGKAPEPSAGLANGPGSEAVGLSNPQMSHQQRRMLDLVNGLHSTGYALLLFFRKIGTNDEL